MIEKNKKIIIGIFFALVILLGSSLFKDYGLSWDEPISHMNGQVSWEYIAEKDPTLWTYSERFYGTIFEMPFAWAQKAFSIDSTQQLFFLRHIGTFLFFVLGLYFFFRLCEQRFKSWKLGLLGAGLLLLSPRIFADGFYNSKDIPLMVAFIIAVYTLSRFLKKPSIPRVFWHAVASALAIAIRIPGIFIPLITIMALVLNFALLKEERRNWRRITIMAGTYLVATVTFTILLWPYLWQQPIEHFSEAFSDMSHFSRQINMQVLYMGEFIKASIIPWHYIPVWVFITTPFLYIVGAFMGITNIFRRFTENLVSSYREHSIDVVVLGWLIGPIVAVILFGSVLYDGWRHLYFVYPALIYMCVLGISIVSEYARKHTHRNKWLILRMRNVVVVVGLVFMIFKMISLHPYQNVYFNFLSGGIEQAREKFDLDYWGLSFREGLEYIASHDSNTKIPVLFAGGTPDNLYILSPEVAGRFEVVSQENLSQAMYVLSNYRWQDYNKLPFELEVFSVKVQGKSILSVFKVK